MIIEVTDLTKSYNRKRVVKKINFSVQKGEIFGILGPNGAGKSTTLEMIEALRPIDGGKVTLNGIDVASEPSKIKHIIGIQLQSTSFANKLIHDVQVPVFQIPVTVFALITGFAVLRIQAIHRPGKYFGGRSLTSTPGAGK